MLQKISGDSDQGFLYICLFTHVANTWRMSKYTKCWPVCVRSQNGSLASLNFSSCMSFFFFFLHVTLPLAIHILLACQSSIHLLTAPHTAPEVLLLTWSSQGSSRIISSKCKHLHTHIELFQTESGL